MSGFVSLGDYIKTWQRDALAVSYGAVVNINGAFPSTYLKASDLQGRRVSVTMAGVRMEDIGGEQKPILSFVGKEKGLVLNKTNANMIAEITGSEETDDWHGQAIVLYPTKTDFQGKRVDAIRVDYPAPDNGRPAKAKTARVVPPEPAVTDDELDQIPF